VETYVIRRVAAAVAITCAVVTIVFLLLRLVPGDVVTFMLGDTGAWPGQVAAMRHALGLDRPLLAQYLGWFGATIRGDFGVSIVSGRPIGGDLAVRAPRSVELAAAALALGVVAGIPLGSLAARRLGGVLDLTVGGVSVLGLTVPSFVVGSVFVLLFGLALHWLPATGYADLTSDPVEHLRHLLLPAVTLSLSIMPVFLRMTRSSVLDTLAQDFVRTARAKGLRETAVLARHVLRNSLIPVVTVVGLQAGTLLGRVVIVENVFNWPGLSSLLLSGILQRDYPVVQAVVLVVAVAFVFINLVLDLAYSVVDPRIRHA